MLDLLLGFLHALCFALYVKKEFVERPNPLRDDWQHEAASLTLAVIWFVTSGKVNSFVLLLVTAGVFYMMVRELAFMLTTEYRPQGDLCLIFILFCGLLTLHWCVAWLVQSIWPGWHITATIVAIMIFTIIIVRLRIKANEAEVGLVNH